MNAIDKIIFNVLASRRPIILPGVGMLSVERRPAVVSDGGMKPPTNRIVFSETGRRDVATVTGHMERMGVDPHKAHQNYDKWLGGAFGDNTLVINGTGVLQHGVFTPSAELEQILNPSGSVSQSLAAPEPGPESGPEPENLVAAAGHDRPENRNNSHCLTNILLTIIIVLLLALVCLYVCNTYRCGKRYAETEQMCNVASQRQIALQDAPPQDESAVGVAPPAPKQDTVRRFHVVAGTYRFESNADALIRWYKVNYPELMPEKVNYNNDRIIVSLFSSDNERDAVRAMQSLSYGHYKSDYWVCKIVTVSY